MNVVILIVLTVFTVGQCDDPIYINKLFDGQLLGIGELLSKLHIKYLNVGNITINDDIQAYGVRLGDVTKIVRKGDATMWTGEDTINDKAAVGIDKLGLLMDSIKLNGRTYTKVLVVVFSNMLSFTQKTYSTQTACNQTYSNIRLSAVKGVMLYSRPSTKLNVTTQFVKEVVPYVNKQLSSPFFLRLLEKYLDACNVKSSNDLFHLLLSLSSGDELPNHIFTTTPKPFYAEYDTQTQSESESQQFVPEVTFL